MSLFAVQDDVQARARAAGMTVEGLLRSEAIARRRGPQAVRRIAAPRPEPVSDRLREIRDSFDKASKRRKEAWRESWRFMVMLAVREQMRSRTTIRKIIDEVCAKTGLDLIDMKSDRRPRKITRIRFYAYWRARHETTFSLPQMGTAFNRDHTSILHGIRVFQAALDAGEEWAVKLAEGGR